MSEVKVVAYRYTASRSFNKPVWHYQATFPSYDNRKVRELGQLQELVLAQDHDKRVAELEAELAEAVELLKVSTALLECNAQPIDKPSIEANKAFLARHGDKP